MSDGRADSAVSSPVDFGLYQALNGLAEKSDRFEDVLQFIALYGQSSSSRCSLGSSLARGKWASRNARHGVVAAGLSAALGLAIAQVIAGAWDRPRPYVAHPDHAHLFISPSPDPSFPAITRPRRLRSRWRSGSGTAERDGSHLRWPGCSRSRVWSSARTTRPTYSRRGDRDRGSSVLLAPPIRGPLHRFADWLAGVYESAGGRGVDLDELEFAWLKVRAGPDRASEGGALDDERSFSSTRTTGARESESASPCRGQGEPRSPPGLGRECGQSRRRGCRGASEAPRRDPLALSAVQQLETLLDLSDER